MNLPKVYAAQTEKFKIDMTLSVNPLGCSPFVLKALKKISQEDISNYPDQSRLRELVANFFKLKSNNIVFGCGSEQLIKLIAQTFVKPNDLVLVQTASFPMFTKEVGLANAEVQFFNPNSFTKPNKKVALVILSNPSTPTGEAFSKRCIEKILKEFGDSIIFIDEANGEYMDESAISLINGNKNLIVSRTFSKLIGLAGVRLGYLLAQQNMIAPLLSAQQPFAASALALKLGMAAFQDREFIIKSRGFIKQQREILKRELITLGFAVSNSVTNNLFVSFQKNNTQRRMQGLQKRLNENGVGVIDSSFFPDLKTAGFRISVKDEQTNQEFLRVLSQEV